MTKKITELQTQSKKCCNHPRSPLPESSTSGKGHLVQHYTILYNAFCKGNITNALKILILVTDSS